MRFIENMGCSWIFDGIQQKNGSKMKTSYHLGTFVLSSSESPFGAFLLVKNVLQLCFMIKLVFNRII